MTTFAKIFSVLAIAGSAAFMAQPTRADHVSVGLGVTIVPARSYAPVYAAPVYSAPVVYAAPTYTTYSTSYYAQSYCPPTVVYSSPAPVYTTPVYYSTPTYYYSSPSYYCPPVYSTPVYYSSPRYYSSFGLGLNFNFGGHDGGHDRHR